MDHLKTLMDTSAVVGGSGSGDKLSTWLDAFNENGMLLHSLSGGAVTTTTLTTSTSATAIPGTDQILGGSNGEDGTGDFTRMLLGSLNISSGDDFTLPPRQYPFASQLNPYEPAPPSTYVGENLQSQPQPQGQPLQPTNQFIAQQNLPLQQQLQQQIEHLRFAQQQQQELQYRLGLYYPQSIPTHPTHQPQPPQPPQPQTQPVPMSYLTPVQPLQLPALGNYLTPVNIQMLAPSTTAPTQPPPPHLSYPPQPPQHQQQHMHSLQHQQQLQQQYGTCTLAHFSPRGTEKCPIPPSANLGGSVGQKGGVEGGIVAPLVKLYQPFYQPDYSDDEEPGLSVGGNNAFLSHRGEEKQTRRKKEEKEKEDEDSESDAEEERPTFPFILKLATKRKEEEHMRFGFLLDPAVRDRPIQLTIKEEILQRPPRKEKTSKKGKGEKESGGSGNGSGGRGRGRGSGKRSKVKESEKEDPHILFRGRLEPGTSGSADMRASSVHGLMTPLHWVLDRQELTLNFKAAEGSGMNIIRYQFHVQDAERLAPPSPDNNNPYYVSDPTQPVRWVAMSVPAIICSHSTSQFQRALLALIHYHFHNQDLVSQDDILACFELLAGGSFKQFREAFSSFPLPAGSPAVRGTDVPAVLEWFLASWKIFSVDNYMALYKLG